MRGVSFRLRPGGVLGLLGPNGSGKSTTVSILAGLLEPSGGTVRLDGQDAGGPARLQGADWLRPRGSRPLHLPTAPSSLTLIGSLRAVPPATLRARIDGFMALFGLTDDIHAPLSAYSKGMRQKILISAALLHNPAIVILDEPNSGLDVTTTLVLRSLVQTLASEGRMVVYSSHVLEIVERVATDVIILNDGRVVAHDSVSRLRDLMELASLEQVFRQLVIETDIDGMASDLVAVMKL